MNTQFESIQSHSNISWIPIRHHSPSCSVFLQQRLKEESVDRVLIEGPSNIDHLYGVIGASTEKHSRAKLPLAIYLFSTLSKGTDTEKAPSSLRCYLPLIELSPEWQAIKWAHKNGIPWSFIDMPYEDQARIDTKVSPEEESVDRLFHDDSALLATATAQYLAQQDGCRDFNEWWDRRFETGCQSISATEYFDNLLSYCLLLRSQLGDDRLTVARETYMAEKIRPYISKGEKCAVVCGGYHCSGIAETLNMPPQRVPLFTPALESNAYIIPYTSQRLNQANGYSAGLPDVKYYELWWAEITKQNHLKAAQLASATEVHERLSIELLELARGRNLSNSITDAIESGVLAERLAALRGVRAGRAEFKDAVLTSFAKGELQSDDLYLSLVSKMLIGDSVGVLPKNALLPPLVQDFKEQCKKFKLSLNSQRAPDKTLDIYRSARSRDISRYLHQLDFLGIPYATLTAGPNFSSRTNLDRVREIWEIQWIVETEATLIESAHLGETVQVAALNKMLKQLSSEDLKSQNLPGLLVQSLVMGMHAMITPIIKLAYKWIGSQRDFAQMVTGVLQLNIAVSAKRVLDSAQLTELSNLSNHAFERSCQLLSILCAFDTEQDHSIAFAIIDLNSLLYSQEEQKFGADHKKQFHLALVEARESNEFTRTAGVITGLLLVSKNETLVQSGVILKAVLTQSVIAPEVLGHYLWGFLAVAKSHLLLEKSIQHSITQTLVGLDDEDFLNALPALRLAFTHLNIREKHQLGAALRQKNDEPIDHMSAAIELNLSQDELLLAHELRKRSYAVLKLWGVK